MQWSNLKRGLLISFGLLIWASPVFASCDALREKVQKEGLDQPSINKIFEELNALAAENDLCAKNLMGRIYYEGKLVPKDDIKSKQIFIEVSNAGYPPALFNLAYQLTQDPTADPYYVVDMLLGIYGTYADNKKYVYLARKSADLGRDYIASLKEPLRTNLNTVFERSLSEQNIFAFQNIKERQRKYDEEFFGALGVVAMVVTAGAVMSSAARGLSAKAATNNYYYTQPAAAPMQNRLYQLYPTGSPNTIYMLPLN